MTTMNFSLPESMRAYVEEQAQLGGFSTVSEYLRALIREDQKRKAQDRLEALLLESLESGVADKLTADEWNEIRKQVQRRSEERKGRAR